MNKVQSIWNDVIGEEISFTNSNLGRLYDDHCSYLPAMAGWFLFSSLLSSYNKFVFGEKYMGFPCPLLLTSIHFLIQWMFSYTMCELFPVSLGRDRILPPKMSTYDWMLISIPCGIVTALDIGLSNLSLVTISITFYTMVKSSTPIFVLGWAYLFKLERITWRLIGVICVIALGEFLTVVGEVDFKFVGFMLCLSAAILSGARWTLVQLKLQSLDPPLQTTLVTMRLLAPSMSCMMLLISIIFEQPWSKFYGQQQEEQLLSSVNATTVTATATEIVESNGFSSSPYETSFLSIVLLGCAGGFLAVAMILCEFYLILNASAIILMIGGVLKEMITILIGISFFGDKLNFINETGCGIVFLGVGLYKLVFHLEKEERKQIRQELLLEHKQQQHLAHKDSDSNLHSLLSPSPSSSSTKSEISNGGSSNNNDESPSSINKRRTFLVSNTNTNTNNNDTMNSQRSNHSSSFDEEALPDDEEELIELTPNTP